MSTARPGMRPGAIPATQLPSEATTTADDDLQAAFVTLEDAAPRWIATPVATRVALLDELLSTTMHAAPAWTAAAAAAKQIDPDGPLAGEDWISGIAPVLRNLALLKRTLIDIEATGRPQPPAVSVRANGQVAIDLLPADPLDRVLFSGYRAHARLAEGVTIDDALQRMGGIYRSPPHDPAVALVLGAGNVSSIAPMDVLWQLFTQNRVVMLKMNPVNAHLGPHIAEAFEPLVADGFLRIVYGGADVGAQLTTHPAVDAIHITGSDKTYEEVVFGPGEEGATRRAQGQRRIDTPVVAELSNVTPVIVVPGPWTDREVRSQGNDIAGMLTNNGGFNCVAPRVLIQHHAWSRRYELLDALRLSLAHAQPRLPYYPGARQRWETFLADRDVIEMFGPQGVDDVPFTLLADLDPDNVNDPVFTTEPFCPIMGEVGLDTRRSVPDFLDAAVEFCNSTLWGTLAVSIIVHPRSLMDAGISVALERAIDNLNYGTVTVNEFPGLTFGLGSAPWGAAPGSTPDDIQSGTGFVHNTYLIDDVEKVVVRAPFRKPVTPLWSHRHQTAHRLGPRLARLIAGDTKQLPAVILDAARG